MTKKRHDGHSTEFGLWLREQRSIDSSRGYVTSNLDYIWENHKTDQFMLIEEKRYGASVSYCQQKLFDRLDAICRGTPGYHGWHLIVFENTSPEDGLIWLDHKQITKDELLTFLRFGVNHD